MLVFVRSHSWFSKLNYWLMFHLYGVYFGMISCDCNTGFSIYLLICLINSLWFSWCWCYALIKNVFDSVFLLHRTIFFLSTITWKFLIFNWLEYVFIVTAYYLRNIFCVTITYFNWVAIEYFMQLVIFWKMFV